MRLALRSIAADGVVEESDEDVHSAIERLLGPLGRKIHAGRSRNDQVAAAFRLYVADACAEADDALVAFAAVLLELADAEAETPLPGYTHLQRAQPVTVGHHLLAWVEMLERDRARFALRGRAGGAVAARRRRARRLDAAAAAASRRDAELARRRRRPRLRARLPLRASPCSSVTSRGSARSSASGRAPSSASRRCPRRPRPARR